MFFNHIYLLILSVCLISSENIEIKIVPEIIIIGQDLTVSCSVSGISVDTKFSVFLQCPFNSGNSQCIQNCKSRDACNSETCNSKAVGDQYFSCTDFENSTNTAFYYYFSAVTRAFLNYSKTVNFACYYKGQYVNKQVRVSEPITTIQVIPSPTKSSIISTNTYFSPSSDFPDIRLIILVSLIGALFVSFLVNVYCTVQLCIKKSKKKHKRRHMPNNQMSTSFPIQDITSNPYSNETSFQDISHDNIKRTKSQPSLSNNERSTPTRSNYNYSSLSNAESVISRSKFSRPNTLTLDNEMSSGSRNSLLTPIFPQSACNQMQPTWNQMQPAIVYFAQYPTYIMPNSQNTFDNLDRVVEQEGPERQNSSLFQPLPQKPNETISDFDSVSN